uniref:Uncharacterized protein n=1 Tax=Meloidogyne enterolobii TaxID=390850 RepID=A0A6V7XNP2_MELEN|nr:unnamed protein product [Meloidogyne enterolobii]CAD2200940.1 unnamed protein product [Meloidogyne enterolobii]
MPRGSAFIDDECEEDLEEMEIDEEEEEGNDDADFSFRDVRAALPPRNRHQPSQNNILIPPGQRGADHIEMFQFIEQGVNYSAKIVDLLSKSKNIEQLKRMETLIGRLSNFDKDMDMDRRAIDETNRQFSKDNSDKKILNAQFKKIRNSLQLENPGRNQQEIEQISSRLTNYIKIIQQGEHQNTQENNDIAEESGEDEEDDMEMLDVYLSDKDPLTKKPIREPVKNPVSLKF